MNVDELLELLRKRRSIRRFKPDPVPEEYLMKILEAGRWAMSGANAQPWEFLVVRDPAVRSRMVDAWFQARREQYAIEQTRIPELRHPQLLKPPTTPGFAGAPVLVVMVADRRTFQATVLGTHFFPGEGGPGATYFKNMANATLLIHLAAASLGLGSQWLSCNQLWAEMLKPILNVPPVLEIHTIVPIGYPAYETKPPYRRELQEITHFDRYDMGKYRSGEEVIQYLLSLRNETKPAYRQEDKS